jgi:hypothetical protein
MGFDQHRSHLRLVVEEPRQSRGAVMIVKNAVGGLAAMIPNEF